jgi:hypothetical protein
MFKCQILKLIEQRRSHFSLSYTLCWNRRKLNGNKELGRIGSNLDRNTKFFHACANQKSRSKQISKIVDKDGRICSTQSEIEGAFNMFFQDLFTVGNNLDVDQSLVALERKVTPQMNEKLVAELNVEEISQALNQMAPLKAPGPMVSQLLFFNKIGLLFRKRYVRLSYISLTQGS